MREHFISAPEKDKVSQRSLCPPGLPRHSSQQLQGFGAPVQEQALDQGADVKGVLSLGHQHTSRCFNFKFCELCVIIFEIETCHRVVPLFCECVTSQIP